MSSTANIFEDDVTEESAAACYMDNLGDTSAIALLIPEAPPGASAAVIGADAIEFMTLLRDHESEEICIDVCGDAEAVHYSQLNSIIIDVGAYILSTLAIPVFVNIFSDYIKSKVSQHNSEDIEVRVEVIKKKGNKRKNYRISGKPKAVLKIVRELEKQ